MSHNTFKNVTYFCLRLGFHFIDMLQAIKCFSPHYICVLTWLLDDHKYTSVRSSVNDLPSSVTSGIWCRIPETFTEHLIIFFIICRKQPCACVCVRACACAALELPPPFVSKVFVPHNLSLSLLAALHLQYKHTHKDHLKSNKGPEEEVNSLGHLLTHKFILRRAGTLNGCFMQQAEKGQWFLGFWLRHNN